MNAARSINTTLNAPSADAAAATSDDTNMASLLGGIVTDMQHLLEDHLQLLKLEMQDDLQKSRNALIPMALSIGLILAACLLLLAALVGWLAWLVPGTFWFVWSAMIGSSFAAVALILFMVGKHRWRMVHPLPEKTLRQVKRTIQSINQQINTESP